jgi:hypothetical protein
MVRTLKRTKRGRRRGGGLFSRKNSRNAKPLPFTTNTVRQYLAKRTKAGYQRRLTATGATANNASTVAGSFNGSSNDASFVPVSALSASAEREQKPVRRARNVVLASQAAKQKQRVANAIAAMPASVQPYQRTYNLSGFNE